MNRIKKVASTLVIATVLAIGVAPANGGVIVNFTKDSAEQQCGTTTTSAAKGVIVNLTGVIVNFTGVIVNFTGVIVNYGDSGNGQCKTGSASKKG